MNRKLNLFLAVTLAMLAASPAFAYNFSAQCVGGVRWSDNDVTWRPSLASFPQGSGWYNSIEASRLAWNSWTPGSNYRINHVWETATTVNNNDGRNSILMPTYWDPTWGKDDPADAEPLAVTFSRRSGCTFYYGFWVEKDIAFNRNYSWENSTSPVAPLYSPYNSTLVALHEHGHGLGLAHENDYPATMNSIYPGGGPIGNGANVHPHADDSKGNRALYGTASTQRDVAAFAYRLSVPADPDYPGATDPIVPPASASRNSAISFQFGVENRGTANQTSVPVHFYLTPTRNAVTTSSFFIGSATLSLNSGATVTPWAYVTIPSNAPAGLQYIGWIIDPYNTITESDELNNGVTHTSRIFISSNSAPVACLNATPTSGNEPLHVSFNAGCSYDPEGSPLTYTWDFGYGYPYAGGAQEEYWYTQGYWVATVTVTDSSGASSQASVGIYVTCDQSGGIACVE